MTKRKIRMGMVGGGQGAFIGAVHRIAANIDGRIDLVCGAFSSDPEKSKRSGEELYLDPARVYGSYEEMIKAEASLPADVRIDLVSIVTPNHVHFGPAKMALEHGLHVVCDKPMTFNLEEAYELKRIVDKTGLIFGLTHAYLGYPMVKQAKHLVASGRFGKIRKIMVEYPQGWLSDFLESSDQKQAAWRTDPTRSGIAGAMGDIGTHAFNLAEHISGLKVTHISSDVSTMVDGRLLDDDGSALLRFDNGARGVLTASQICSGEENSINIRIYGEKGGLEWHQIEPNTLIVKEQNKQTVIYRTGVGELCHSAAAHTRVPAGHPEGYLEAFANIYRNVAMCIEARNNGTKVDPVYEEFPGVDDGVRGMEFIYRIVESSKNQDKWLKF
jgi:predicted dehydrogenase